MGNSKESEPKCLIEAPNRSRHRRLVGAIVIEERKQGEDDICHGAGHNTGQNDVCQGVVDLKEEHDEARKEKEDRSVEEKGYGIRDGIKPESEHALIKVCAYARPALRG
jgi:hypothetical protein